MNAGRDEMSGFSRGRRGMPHRDDGSVTGWIGDLKAGDDDAARLLWDRYFQRLVQVARARLERAHHPGAGAEAEDAALSAFDSFCDRAKRGLFPRLRGRDELRRLLVTITLRKSADRIDLHLRRKRGGGRVVGEVDLPRSGMTHDPLALDRFAGPQPRPELAAVLQDEFERLLQTLGDDTLRAVALGKLAGYTDEEVAENLGCARRTVVNKLRLIRTTWEEQP
jgi:DNA-directed RNA polymerase specialized sigma24 family protein